MSPGRGNPPGTTPTASEQAATTTTTTTTTTTQDSKRSAGEPLTLEELEGLNNHAAGRHFPSELVEVVRLRSEARQRSVLRQRRDAREAVERTLPNSLTDPEIVMQRGAATLYTKLVKLEKAGKIRWDAHKSDWVARPVFTRTDQSRPPAYTVEELLSRFDRVRRNGKRWTARCPAHTDRTPSLAIAEGDSGWLVKCWTGCSFDEIVAAADLDSQRMFFS